MRGPNIPVGDWDCSVQSMYLWALAFESWVVELPCERDEAVEVVGAALPGFTFAAKPSAVGPYVWPGFIEVAAQAVGLKHELSAEPAGGFDSVEREWVETCWGPGGARFFTTARAVCCGSEVLTAEAMSLPGRDETTPMEPSCFRKWRRLPERREDFGD